MAKLNLNNATIRSRDCEPYTAICCSGGIGTSKTKYIGYKMVCGCEIKLDRWCFCNAINPDAAEGLFCGDFTKMIEKAVEETEMKLIKF